MVNKNMIIHTSDELIRVRVSHGMEGRGKSRGIIIHIYAPEACTW